MKKIITFLLFTACVQGFLMAQVKSPKEYLGYEIGDQFTYAHQAESYFKEMAEKSPLVSMEYYGLSYEGRPLYVIYISSSANINKLNEIKQSNIVKTGLQEGKSIENQPVVVWLSYNIHGNEAVSVETALMTAYEIVSKASSDYKEWLDKSVIVIDPCLNPDGHTRYVQFYKERMGRAKDVQPFTREHLEPWPGGRPNHYFFDLNRDWAWQTQKETKQRIRLLNSWMPQVHIDFHEMGINSPYFFAPAAEPVHEYISPWQRNFHQMVGQHLGKAFDERNWRYFAGEVFDLFYPSYGDTYPSFNGSMGMTYEVGGSGRAGLGVLSGEGDTLTLRNRIDMHYIAGLKTIELAVQQSDKLVQNFESYFTTSKANPVGKYKSFVIKSSDQYDLKQVYDYLIFNGIQCGYGAAGNSKSIRGLSYKSNEMATFNIDASDIVISAYQPKSVLLQTLMEPLTTLPDSNTYDITGWALPFAWGLDAFAVAQDIKPGASQGNSTATTSSTINGDAIAYAFQWNNLSSVKGLSLLIQSDVVVRMTSEEMKFKDITLSPGSMIVQRDNGTSWKASTLQKLQEMSEKYGCKIIPLTSSLPSKGPSFGSSAVQKLDAPRIGLLSGKGTSSNNVGEIWHFFDQELEYPIHLIEADVINESVLQKLDVLIIPSLWGGNAISENLLKQIVGWARKGGRIIAFENAVDYLQGKEGFGIQVKKGKEESKEDLSKKTAEVDRYKSASRESLSGSNSGSIIKVMLDHTHPLAYGYDKHTYLLKTNNRLYAPLNSGWNVGVCQQSPVVSGFVGYQLKAQMENFLSIGTESIGRGDVVYFGDNPIFRSFWNSGKLLVANAVFMNW
jgi:hypothetical protein